MRLTPPEQRAPAAKFPQPSTSLAWLVGAVAWAALVFFLSGLLDGAFVDEYAYITQSYYADLFFSGRRDDPAWLDDLAYDLQPLPKYFIGPALHAAHLPIANVRIAALWYRDAHTRFGPPRTLTVARLPFIATGVLASLALLGFGLLIGGRGVGVAAAVLLTINPLFRLHAHRAMSDVPCEAFMAAGLGLALWGAGRIWSGRHLGIGLSLFAAAGVFSGLSIVCKLNGILAPLIVSTWCVLGALLPQSGARGRVGLLAGAALSMATMLTTIVLLNPSLTCRPRFTIEHPVLATRAAQGPWGRFLGMVKYRLEITAGQLEMPKFQEYVVRSPSDKVAVVAVQGFGRFGPFGPSESVSTIRYDLRQDWGMILWGPLVLFGAFRAYRWGRRQIREGQPPTALALLIWALVSVGVVTVYLPLAWDRYLLPIQAPNAVLGAVGLSALWERWRRKAVEA